MAKQVIDIGTTANDGTGDVLRTAFDKANDNFTELYDFVSYDDVASTTALSESDLDTLYPTAVVGFKVFALSIILGALVYTKTPSGWVATAVTVVV